MSDLLKKIENDLNVSMKLHEKTKTETLKLLKCQIINFQKESKNINKIFTDEDCLTIIQKFLKQRQDAIQMYFDNNRKDLYEIESEQYEIVKIYLPQQMIYTEIEEYVKLKISENSFTNKEIGKLMGVLSKDLKGKADMKVVKNVVTKLLNN